MSDQPARLPIVVLISGRGSNLQSIIDAIAGDGLPVEIRAVISNRPDAAGLRNAMRAGIKTAVLEHREFADRESFDTALQKLIDDYAPRLVVLAGFMRVLTPAFVAHYTGRMLNIHPSLLPAFPGLRTHERALAAGMTQHGASVHFVTTEVDGGPLIAQARIAVLPDDNADTLGARVLEQEHRLYPQVLRWFAENRVRLQDGCVILDGETLATPRLLQETKEQASA